MTEDRVLTGTTTRLGKRTRRRSSRLTAAAAVCGLALAACGSNSTSTPQSKNTSTTKTGVVNVVWWNMWSGATVPITQKMVSAFNATHPSIHVTELNVPVSSGDAKLLSSIAAGDPPDVFTEWNPVLGEYAQTGAIQSMNKFLTGKYANLEKWMYPVALKGGVYKSQLIGVPMSMNSLALYYNKRILGAAHISPPKTLAQLDADQAKLWKISSGRLEQIGFYPLTSASSNPITQFTSYFGVKGYVNGKYALASNPRAIAEMNWLASYSHYPYSAVQGLDAAFGTVNGGSEDAFDMGKAAFYLDGPWEGYENVPADNPSLVGHFGVESFPTVPGGPAVASTWVNGNYNIIPKGAKHPSAAFQFIAWLAGYNNETTMSKILPTGGWVPASPQVASAPAYKTWLSTNPYLKPFITQFSSKYSRQTQLTPAESVYDVALTNAAQYVATGKMSAMAALRYIDSQANAALAKG